MSKTSRTILSLMCWTTNTLGTGEEVKNSAIVVPRSMVIAMIISGALTMAFSIAILFGIGDIYLALQSPTHYPIIQIFYTATRSKGATTAIICTLISALTFTTFGLLACASRLAWAFARDKGLPFPDYFAHVSILLCKQSCRGEGWFDVTE